MTTVMPHIHEKAPTREPSESEIKALLKRVSACRTKLLAVVPFFGHLCLNLTPRIARPQDRVDTAAVSLDGTMILNADFCAKLTDAQLCGLLCHEVMHPALLCWQRQGTRLAIVADENGEGKFSLWNLAHDLSFNPEILELAERSEAKGQVELPPDGALDQKMKGMAAEEIYDALLKKAKKGKGGGSTIRLPGNGKHGIGDDMRTDLSDSEEGQKAAQGNSASQRKLEEDWKVNVVAAAQVQEKEKGKGTLPAGLQKYVDDLTDPKVDWKDVLSRWIGENGRRQDYTYRRPARRSESVGEYLPSLQKFGVSDIVILWDTSGSMNGRETEILSEVQAICEDLGLSVRVICIDTAIHSDVSDIQDALDVIPHIKGGGGSNFCPAFERLDQEQYDGVVVSFTDGYIDVPETKPHLLKAVLWVIGEHDTDPTSGKWGEVLHMNDEAMGR
jgi:predicted metal-dependent peptidase